MTNKEFGTEELHPIEMELNVPYENDTPDYHFSFRKDSSVAIRSSNRVGPIYANAIYCKECKTYVRSKNVHDYRMCKCTENPCGVDGGSQYMRRVGDCSKAIDMSILFDNVKIVDNTP